MMVGTALVSALVSTSGGVALAGAASTQDVVSDTNKHIIVNTFGNCVRTKWEMGSDACAAPAAPPPAPAPAPVSRVIEDQRSYLVFFDFDRYNLTEDATRIIGDLFARTRGGSAVQYSITGHADRSGSDAYNLRLSERRASAVRQELQRLGVPGEAVAVDWKGERAPLVPTDDGIKEPQNRRSEIRVRMEVRQ
jgi:outer membrane protein OmpA-like peptidoglycan-associated protein